MKLKMYKESEMKNDGFPERGIFSKMNWNLIKE